MTKGSAGPFALGVGRSTHSTYGWRELALRLKYVGL
jgi:hypothetical protein